MKKFTLLIRNRHGLIDPATVADVCTGFAALCRHLPVVVEGQRVEVRARIRSLKHGSLKLEFILRALEQATNNPDIRAIAAGIAANTIFELFKHFVARSEPAKQRKVKEARELLRNPEIASDLRDILSALNRDPVTSEIEVSTSSDSVKIGRERIERAEQEVREWAREPSHEETVLWGKHAQIKEVVGTGANQEWRIWWDDKSQAGQTTTVRAPRIPSNEPWKPKPNKRIVVDLRVRYRGGNKGHVESAEILGVHWREMRES